MNRQSNLMSRLKNLLLTTPIALLLGFYLSTLIPKLDQGDRFGRAAAEPMAVTEAPIAVRGNQDQQQNHEVALLKTELSALRAEMAGLRQEMHRIAALKSMNTEPTKQKAEKVPVSNDATVRAEEAKYFAEQSAALEADFRQQAVDAVWALETTALVKKGLLNDKASAGNAIISLECRHSSCRLELANDSHHRMPDFTELSAQITDELPNIMVSQAESDDNSTVFYLSKEEVALPQ